MEPIGIKFEIRTEEFGGATQKAAGALDKEEATAKRLAKWQKEMASIARQSREEKFKELGAEKQMEQLLQRRVQLEERIARAANNQVRQGALRLQQARNEQRIRDTQRKMPEQHGFDFRELISTLPLGAAGLNIFDKLKSFGGGKFLPGAAVGAAAIGGIELVKHRMESARALIDMSGKTGLGVSDLKGITYGESATGADKGTVLNPYQQFSERVGNLRAGIGRSEQTLRALKTLGIGMEELGKKTPLKVFTELMDRMKEGAVTNEQYAAGIRLMGDAFRELVPLARKGLGGFIGEASGKPINTGRLEVYDQLGREYDEKRAAAGKVWKGFKNGAADLLFGGASAIGGALFAGLGALSKGGASASANSMSQKLLGFSYKMFGGAPTGEQAVVEQQKQSADAKDSAAHAKQIDESKAKIRQLAGDDADDLLDTLAESGRPADYEKAVARLERQKGKDDKAIKKKAATIKALAKRLHKNGGAILAGLEQDGAGPDEYDRTIQSLRDGTDKGHGDSEPVRNSDQLARIGLFTGAGNPFKTEMEAARREIITAIQATTNAVRETNRKLSEPI